MKRLLFITILSLSVLPVAAQELPDSEFHSLVSAVCGLRVGGEGAYDTVKEQLKSDMLWTPMNETGPFREDECHPSERVPGFRLNRLLSMIAGERKYVTSRGDMLNGEDKRYDYSLYERSVHSGATVTYILRGREGRQWFAIVPHDGAGSGLEASVSVDGGPGVALNETGDGILSVYLDTPDLSADKALLLSVTGGRENQSFVILNHNTRNK